MSFVSGVLPVSPASFDYSTNAAQLNQQIVDLSFGLDKAWIITCSGFVFLMLVGLGLMEIGSIRRKNSRVVWYKILVNLIMAIWWMWILGFAWGFGNVNGSFIGAETYYAGGNYLNAQYNQLISYQNNQYAHFLWRCAQAVVATTIATAIMSERISIKAVVVFNMFFNMIILPFVYAWTFGLGFLTDDIGYFDYAGSFVIFGTGAIAGLVGLLFIKPRYNRYGRYPSVIPTGPVAVSEIRSSTAGHRNLPPVSFDRYAQEASAPVGTYSHPTEGPAAKAFTAENILIARKRQDEDEYEHFGITDFGRFCLGAIIFFIGFIFFNGGASLGLKNAFLYTYAEVAASGTILAASGAGLVTMIFVYIFARARPVRENAATIAKAFVAGMVCVAAGVNTYIFNWQSFVVGMVGAAAYIITANILYRSQVDDPPEFFAVFGTPGFIGLFCAAFFNTINGIFYDNSTEGEIIIDQLLSAAIIGLWTAFVSTICFGLLRLLRILRVGLKCEVVGYDYIDGARHLDYPEKGSVDQLKQEKVV
jgi:ammonia channel protein AmtB